MAVRCSKCGEELLGAVNRCWKCGQQFAAQPDATGLPPVRYTPLTLPSDVVLAEVAGSVATATPPEGAPSAEVATASPPADLSQPKPIRTGSPFVAGALMQPVTTPGLPQHTFGPPPPSRIPGPPLHDPVAVAGAIASILMGLFALSIAWMQTPVCIAAAALIAIIGFSLGIWGLYSKRRGWALFGILISCAAIGLATYSGSIVLYESMREHDEQVQGN